MDARAKHLRVYRYQFECLAYRSLSLAGRCLLDEILFRHNGQNNGFIVFSHTEAAERLNVNRRTAAKAFVELEKRGFIKARVRGRFLVGHRQASEWIITDEEYNGREPTKEFMRWQPLDENKTRVHSVHTARASSTRVVNFNSARKARK